MKKFISTIVATACIVVIAAPAIVAAEKVNSQPVTISQPVNTSVTTTSSQPAPTMGYQKTFLQMSPFVTQDIPEPVKNVAKDFKSYIKIAPTTSYSQDITIDLANAFVSYEGIDLFTAPAVNQNIKYYTFNIGMPTGYSVYHQITISYDGTTAKYVSNNSVKNTRHARADGLVFFSGNYEQIYNANQIFTEYLKSIKSTDKPILVRYFDKAYIYEPVSQTIMLVNDFATVNGADVNRKVYSFADIKAQAKAFLLNDVMTDKTIPEAMSHIKPLYTIDNVSTSF